jgi:inositol-hexakisphosphate kinase
MNECEYNQQTCIQLSPFFHQVKNDFFNYNFTLCFFPPKVGGHSSMFQYDKDTICKILELHELDFYHSMPDSLKKFTPEFRGIITVQYCEDELGYIKLVARPETDDEHSSNDEDLPPTTTDQQSTDNDNSKKSVQLVLKKKYLVNIFF